MKNKNIVTYVFSLLIVAVTSISLDRFLTTTDAGWALITGFAGILSLFLVALTFSNWKK